LYIFAEKSAIMKKIVWILIIIAMMAGCNEARNPLLKEAAEIVHQRPDSARVLISNVDTASLGEADRMEYNLLKVMTDYIVLHQAEGDSLISTCVDYYDHHGDAWHRGRAYYYRAGIRMRLLGRMVDGVKDYKMAERIAEDTDEELLKNMVYENLAYANYYCLNHTLMLNNSQKFLESSRKMNDSVMMMRGLHMCAAAYSQMKLRDNAYDYIVKSMDYINLADSLLRSDIYFNVGVMYQEKKDEQNAQKYLDLWKKYKTAASTKGNITKARLLKAQRHYEEAIEIVKSCTIIKDPLIHINALELLAELYELTDDKGEALEAKKQVDEYRDSVMTVNHSLEIADWQQRYDEERWEENSQRKMMGMAGIITAIVLALAIGVWWHCRRVKALGFQLDEHARRMTENRMEIERLQESGEASEQTIAELNRQIEVSRQRISNKLLVGTRCFVRMQQKDCIADLTSEERQCLIDYFALLRPKRWQEWEHTYASLTTAQYVFLILQDDLHYDDDTIAKILNVKPASLRTLRSRIKGREK
jgi:tetratricopeptide (TPR) repeat protein